MAKAKSKEQIQRFIAAARELGCDDDEGAFDKALGTVARAAPKKVARKRKLAKPPNR